MRARSTHRQARAMALESKSRAAVDSAVRSDDREDRLLTAQFVRLALADLAYFTAAGVAIYALLCALAMLLTAQSAPWPWSSCCVSCSALPRPPSLWPPLPHLLTSHRRAEWVKPSATTPSGCISG